MLTLHHLEYSQSFRILWLLEELGVEYELKSYNRDPQTMLAPADYKALSPLGSAPVIEHDGLVLAESAAIMDYILDLHPSDSLRPPPGAANRTRFLFWWHAGQGSLMPLMLMETVFTVMAKRAPFLIRPILKSAVGQAMAGLLQPRMVALMKLAEADLGTAPWFGGDELTAADIMICYPMEAANARGYITDAHPNCRAWLERMRAHPSFQAATVKDARPSMVFSLPN